MILINIHASRRRIQSARRRWCMCAERTRRPKQREREKMLLLQGIARCLCNLFYTLWRPHKDVAQPTAKILDSSNGGTGGGGDSGGGSQT
jgi:type II secretory pathway component PulM